MQFDGVEVFTATKSSERRSLGHRTTEWLRANPGVRIVDKVVTQSSDAEFHCLTITLFYRNNRRTRQNGRNGGERV